MNEENLARPLILKKTDDIFYFSLISHGETGADWIQKFKEKKCYLDNNIKNFLLTEFKPLTPATKIELAILNGKLFKNGNRSTLELDQFAIENNLSKTNLECGLLAWEALSTIDFGHMDVLWIVIFHDISIKISKTNFETDSLITLFRNEKIGLSVKPKDENSQWGNLGGYGYQKTN